jgi:arabinofuranan 3-O-arabinosyltransferase
MPAPVSLPRRLVPALLAAGALAVAFAQRPGKTVFDTRIELSVDPSLFLHRVAAVWSSTGDLGHVQSGQFVGYLFPMAPWFALVQWTGMPMWVGQRLWLGGIVAIAAWGVVRLIDELFDRRRGVAHLTAGALYAFNPYVAVWTTRGSLALVAYAVVPWLMLAAHRGLRDPHGWRWPALVGLGLAASGAGVNAAVVVWILPAPIALGLYEASVLRLGLGRLGAFAWRASVCAVLGAAWWVVPLFLQARFGTDILSFTELPSSVWATTSMPESIRLLGYWLLYLGLGGVPVVPLASTYLFNVPVILATFFIPVFAFATARWRRTWAFTPFFCFLAVLGLLLMTAGFPSGTPLHSLLTSAYYDLEPLRFLRTSYKAAPLVAITLAALGGVGLSELVAHIRAATIARNRRLVALSAVGAAAAAVVVLYALPLFEGRAIDKAQAYGAVPRPWRSALKDAERSTPANHRLMLLPGALFGYYRWGNTVSSIAPALSRRPVLIRELVPYAEPHAAELLNSVDDLVQQGRLVPGQLRALLELMGVGAVAVYTDGLPAQSGSLDPAQMAEVLQGQHGFEHSAAGYGPPRTYVPMPGRGGPSRRLRELRLYRTPGTRAPGIVRVQARTGATVIDGDAQGIAALAASHEIDPSRPLFYASDLGGRDLRGLVRGGARLVFTDSNRRRLVEPDLLRANTGPTMGPTDHIPPEWPNLDPFTSRGSAAETVAVYTGLRYLRSPADRGFPLFPEHRPYAALDGKLDTSWLADAVSSATRRYLELGLSRPRDLSFIRIFPASDRRGATDRLAISVNGGSERRVFVHRGWNSIPLAARGVRTLRVRVLGLGAPAAPAGIAELAVPGLKVSESLRIPTGLAAATRRLDLSHVPISVLLNRATRDLPNLAPPGDGRKQSAADLNMTDAEMGLVRDVDLPVARRFGLSGWARPRAVASDATLDRLAGVRKGWTFRSSGRYEGVPGRRASSAFDGRNGTAWVGAGDRPWIAVHAPHRVSIRRFQIEPGPREYAFPLRVRVATAGRRGEVARVGADGAVQLRRRIRSREVKISVVRSRRRAFSGRSLDAVAIGEIRVAGLVPPHLAPGARFATRCGALQVHARGVIGTLRVVGTVAALDQGAPLRVLGCGRRDHLLLPAGTTRVTVPEGRVILADHLNFGAPAPVPLPTNGSQPPGSVVSPGKPSEDGSVTHVQLRLSRPAWLVLGQSYSSGWRAWCRSGSGNERPLGPPALIDGFANGWRVRADCREVRFAFAPQRLADVGYGVSAAACLVMLAMVVFPRWRRRPSVRARPHDRVAAADLVPVKPHRFDDPVRRTGAPLALVVGFGVAGLASSLYGLRVGIAFGVGTAVLLFAGVSSRRLLAVAAVGVGAIAALYLLDPAPRPTGLVFSYATHFATGQWVGTAAIYCVAASAVLAARGLRSALKPSARPAAGWTSEESDGSRPIQDGIHGGERVGAERDPQRRSVRPGRKAEGPH